MKKVAFIVDNSLIDVEDFQLPADHYLVQLPITEKTTNNSVEYGGDNSISFSDLKIKSAQGSHFTTGAILLGECRELIEKLLLEYEKIVVCCLSPHLSSSFQSWNMIADNFDPHRIYVWPNVVLGSSFFTYSQAVLAETKLNYSWNQIRKILTPSLDFRGLLLVNELSALERGGRISSFKALLGTVLKMKILINYENGQLGFYDKHTTKKSTYKAIESYFLEVFKLDLNQSHQIILWSSYIDKDEFNNELKNLQTYFPNINFVVKEIPKPILVHVGINAMAFILL